MKTLQKLLLLAAILWWSVSAKGTTHAEYESHISALQTILNNLVDQVTCLEQNLAMYVGDDQARQMREACSVTTPTNTGTGLQVIAPLQPGASIAPLGAARMPFTKVTFTAGTEDVTVNGLVVERVGSSVDAALESVMLLDEDGIIMGTPRFLNSNHQATIGGSFTVKAGQSRTLTLAGTRPNWGTASHAGMTVGLSLVAVNTTATVSGVFPITGPLHVINEGLMIGQVVTMRGSTDPGLSEWIHIGTSNRTFSSIRITAGSTENVRLRAIRWYQSGSAIPADLENVKTYVNGVPYDTLVSQDGKYWTSVFGSQGIMIEKASSKEVAIRGDLVGGAGRTVDFDIEQRSDLYLVGDLYGFGITPPFGSSSIATPDSSAFSFVDHPWYDASQVTVSAGDITVSPSVAVPSQNVTPNTVNQPLGGFIVTVRGEPISVGRMGFNVALNFEGRISDDVDDLTNLTLVDESGTVVAGPVDGSAADSIYTAGSADGSVVFTAFVTFPVGTHLYRILGKVGVDLDNNSTIQFSTTPATDFAIVRGQTSNVSTTPSPLSSVVLQTMTVKTASLFVSVPAGQTDRAVIAGSRQAEGLKFRLDTTASSEGIRNTTFPLVLTVGNGGKTTDITNVGLYDGATRLNTGSNTLNPVQDGLQTITLDGNGPITREGLLRDITVRFDLRSGAVGTYQWSLPERFSNTSTFGIATANAITPVLVGSGAGPVLRAIQHGSYTVSATPVSERTYEVVRAGSVMVSLGNIFYTASVDEDIDVKQGAFALLSNYQQPGSAFVGRRIFFYDGATKVGEASIFPGNSVERCVVSYSVPLIVRKGECSRVISAYVDLVLQDINNSDQRGISLSLVYDGDSVGLNGNYALGLDSGANIPGPTGTTWLMREIGVFRNVPHFWTTRRNIRPVAGDNSLTFVVANEGDHDLGLKKVTFRVVQRGLKNIQFVLREDGVAANSIPVVVANGFAEVVFDATSAAKIIPAQGLRHYALVPVSFNREDWLVEPYLYIELEQDTLLSNVGTVAQIEGGVDSADNIIWTPFTATVPAASAESEQIADWVNSYGVIFDAEKGDVAPLLQSITVSQTSGHAPFIVIKGTGMPGEEYTLESSTDLLNWKRKPWAPMRVGADGQILLEFESMEGDVPREFFRVVSVP